ncbi:MAG: T9SS type A sorting domain-containing protein [Saprospiraceae bacterium]
MESTKHLFLLACLCLPSFLFTQNWFNEGDVFHYSLHGFSAFYGFEKIQYNRDTLIDSKVCKIIRREVSFRDGSNPEEGITHFTEEEVVFEHGDTLSLLVDNQFYPLYNFGLRVGDTLTVPMLNENQLLCEGEDLYELYLILLEAGTMNVDGQELRTQRVKVVNPFFGADSEMLVAEKIGAISFKYPNWTPPTAGFGAFFFYTFNYQFACYVDGPEYGFRCFSNNDISYKVGEEDCDFIVLSNNDLSDLDTRIQFIPNPATDFIKIQLDQTEDLEAITIFTVDGKMVKSYPGNQAAKLSLQDMKQGIYFLQLRFKNGESMIKKLLKL